MRKISFALCITLFANHLIAQDAIVVPLDSESWDTENAEFLPATFQGKEAILLNDGYFLLKDVEFLNGVIEVDINFSNRRNFPGVNFRIQENGSFENFYVRPHQSGNPDANQYTPVFNQTAGWQLYHGESWAVPINYSFDTWHHIKIAFSGRKADIYFDDMKEPALQVDLLGEMKPGKVGFSTGIAPVYYANFSYTITEGPTSVEPLPSKANANAITSWQVSNVFKDSLLLENYELDKTFKNSLTWNKYESESSGLINLARYGRRSPGNTTVAVKVVIESNKAQVKRLDFGFSDLARVYVNDKAVFEGHDRFRSRDYRYLGTIGYFDAVFLPLKKGTNELWFMVSEAFGGWGLQAKFKDMEGITLPQ